MVRLSPDRQAKRIMHGPWPLQASLSVLSGRLCRSWVLLAGPARDLVHAPESLSLKHALSKLAVPQA